MEFQSRMMGTAPAAQCGYQNEKKKRTLSEPLHETFYGISFHDYDFAQLYNIFSVFASSFFL